MNKSEIRNPKSETNSKGGNEEMGKRGTGKRSIGVVEFWSHGVGFQQTRGRRKSSVRSAMFIETTPLGSIKLRRSGMALGGTRSTGRRNMPLLRSLWESANPVAINM